MRLSDTIEQFIKTMLTHDENEIELKRNELAEYFNCAPSQINYVLATRFTPGSRILDPKPPGRRGLHPHFPHASGYLRTARLFAGGERRRSDFGA